MSYDGTGDFREQFYSPTNSRGSGCASAGGDQVIVTTVISLKTKNRRPAKDMSELITLPRFGSLLNCGKVFKKCVSQTREKRDALLPGLIAEI